MKKITEIKDNQILLIRNESEYESHKHMLRYPEGTIPALPCFFEPVNSVTRGHSVGITHSPLGTNGINPEIIYLTH
jgi:hypothetical protein